jgi:hypothetical protein
MRLFFSWSCYNQWRQRLGLTLSVIARETIEHETEKMLRASGLTPHCTKQVLDTGSDGRALVACQVGSYEASSVCVPCPGGQTSSAGATSASECHFCAAGSYPIAASSQCVACPAGFMKDVVEDAACTPCPEGQTSSAGATECHYCAAGSYVDVTSLLCVACPAGFLKDVVEDAACTPCPGGQTSSAGASECHFCAAGSYVDVTSLLCVACPAGFMKDVVGDEACTPCPGGNTSLVGATSASRCFCPTDSYLNATSSLCVHCPGGQHSSLGATSAAECYCPAGVFTNCDLNGLLEEHTPHSVYVGEAWDGSTLPDLSGNGRHAALTVVPLYWQTEQAVGG